ncbi:transglutaminase-like domain-containing protein [Acidisoma cladoniae]|jgi:transglutaminase-like putative cysteine protease|uniref:transglutaminase-like domain-containing protein n=1 Tax=Acidisoma cladoniae TaxID=3040935 RepID=UPI00254EC1E5|nr:transglutaminase family protein [Acidisoma sp. PAMC 29798]
MLIRLGYEITFQVPQPTPMVLMLNVRPERTADLLSPDTIYTNPYVPVTLYYDVFGNLCSRVLAPAGDITFTADAVINDPGVLDPYVPSAQQIPVEDLPPETLQFLLGSRYCETEKLSDFAWQQFGHIQDGWSKVEAIVDYTHNHITFGYPFARNTRTAYEGWQEQVGVCRDFAHLALTLCRCMNIPARYCTGYLGDIGVPPDTAPMDFSGWFQAFLGGEWYTFDARHGRPRIGRVLIAVGRDASDVAISTIFGPSILKTFKVVTLEEAS